MAGTSPTTAARDGAATDADLHGGHHVLPVVGLDRMGPVPPPGRTQLPPEKAI